MTYYSNRGSTLALGSMFFSALAAGNDGYNLGTAFLEGDGLGIISNGANAVADIGALFLTGPLLPLGLGLTGGQALVNAGIAAYAAAKDKDYFTQSLASAAAARDTLDKANKVSSDSKAKKTSKGCP